MPSPRDFNLSLVKEWLDPLAYITSRTKAIALHHPNINNLSEFHKVDLLITDIPRAIRDHIYYRTALYHTRYLEIFISALHSFAKSFLGIQSCSPIDLPTTKDSTVQTEVLYKTSGCNTSLSPQFTKAVQTNFPPPIQPTARPNQRPNYSPSPRSTNVDVCAAATKILQPLMSLRFSQAEVKAFRSVRSTRPRPSDPYPQICSQVNLSPPPELYDRRLVCFDYAIPSQPSTTPNILLHYPVPVSYLPRPFPLFEDRDGLRRRRGL